MWYAFRKLQKWILNFHISIFFSGISNESPDNASSADQHHQGRHGLYHGGAGRPASHIVPMPSLPSPSHSTHHGDDSVHVHAQTDAPNVRSDQVSFFWLHRYLPGLFIGHCLWNVEPRNMKRIWPRLNLHILRLVCPLVTLLQHQVAKFRGSWWCGCFHPGSATDHYAIPRRECQNRRLLGLWWFLCSRLILHHEFCLMSWSNRWRYRGPL